MRYFWIVYQVELEFFKSIVCQVSKIYPTRYFTKYHPLAHHHKVHPYYVQMHTSLWYLPKSLQPMNMKGCFSPLPATSMAWSGHSPLHD